MVRLISLKKIYRISLNSVVILNDNNILGSILVYPRNEARVIPSSTDKSASACWTRTDSLLLSKTLYWLINQVVKVQNQLKCYLLFANKKYSFHSRAQFLDQVVCRCIWRKERLFQCPSESGLACLPGKSRVVGAPWLISERIFRQVDELNAVATCRL